MNAPNKLELIPGKLYKAKCTLGFCVKTGNINDESDLVIVYEDDILVFIKETFDKEYKYSLVLQYFLYGARHVYVHKYDMSYWMKWVEMLT